MMEHHQKALRAMLDAKRAFDAADKARDQAWAAYLRAQSEFTGKFATSQYPLGPFVCGDVLIEHDEPAEPWPPQRDVFNYRDVIRCPTSE